MKSAIAESGGIEKKSGCLCPGGWQKRQKYPESSAAYSLCRANQVEFFQYIEQCWYFFFPRVGDIKNEIVFKGANDEQIRAAEFKIELADKGFLPGRVLKGCR